jgi:PHD/YefM family antitoxin component YafN of YafNO toxin-antitoxin module
MTKVTSGEFTREFGRYRALAQREALVITNHGRDDLVLMAVQDYARLRRYEPQALHVSQLSRDVIAEFGSVAVSKAAEKYNREYKR